jgi:outer membrane protein insertion porin family
MQAMERFLLSTALWAGVLVGLLLASRAALAQGPAASGKVLISDVLITGNQRMSTEQIKVRLRTQPGNEYNPALIDQDVRELYKTNQFSNIQTWITPDMPDHPDRAKVFFSVREMPNVLQKITFLGAKHIKEEELRKLVSLNIGMPLNPRLNLEGCRHILEKYEEMGRLFSYCQLIKGNNLADTEVVYQITEGPKVVVRNIQFIGNTFVGAGRLEAQIKSSKQLLGLIGGTYNRQMVDADVGELYKYSVRGTAAKSRSSFTFKKDCVIALKMCRMWWARTPFRASN